MNFIIYYINYITKDAYKILNTYFYEESYSQYYFWNSVHLPNIQCTENLCSYCTFSIPSKTWILKKRFSDLDVHSVKTNNDTLPSTFNFYILNLFSPPYFNFFVFCQSKIIICPDIQFMSPLSRISKYHFITSHMNRKFFHHFLFVTLP